MNTTSVAAFVIILAIVREHFCDVLDDVGNFFKSIPGELKSAFQKAWKAIKKPFKSDYDYTMRASMPLILVPKRRGLRHWEKLPLPQYILAKGEDFKFRRRPISKLAELYIRPHAYLYLKIDHDASRSPKKYILTDYTYREVPRREKVVTHFKYEKKRPIDHNGLALN